jgi:hypothetical protein
MQNVKAQERRRSRRIRIGQPMKLRPSDPKDAFFEDTTTTKNVSREGVYFITHFSTYTEGMRLFVEVPYHVPHDVQDREYIGQVVRVDALPNKQWGIAVQLLSDWRGS